MLHYLRKTFAAALAVTALASCGPTIPQWKPYKEQAFYGVAVRQLPPQPVYNRLRLVYLPEPLPGKDLQVASYNKILPVFEFEIGDGTIEEASRVLAETARYTSYCSSVIADRKFSFVGLGTIDELAAAISQKAAINVVVDHVNREVRFLANGTISPFQSAARSDLPEAAGAVSPTRGVEGGVKPDFYRPEGSAVRSEGSPHANAKGSADEH